MPTLTPTKEERQVKTGGGVYGSRKQPKTFKTEPLHYIEFTKLTLDVMLMRLARLTGPVATTLYARMMRAWTRRRQMRVRITVSPAERALLEELGTDFLTETGSLKLGVVSCPLWIVKYRNEEHDREVVVRTQVKPTRQRRFRVPGHGKPKFEAVAVKRINTNQEGNTTMGTKSKGSTKSKAKNRKAAEADTDVDDELDGIEEDLDDLDDLDEPAAEEEDEKPKRGKSKRSRSKSKKAKEAEDDDEEEEDDEDELSGLTLKALRAKAKEAGVKGASKKDKEELIKAINSADEDDEDEDDEDEEDEKPAKKKKGAAKGGKKSSGSKKGQAPPTRELPKGKFGATEIAELADTDGRTVRQFLRRHTDEFPKDEELGRYSFNKKDAQRIAKRIAKEQDDD